jgi:hypothetical protein
VLHQAGVSFDLYYDARKHKIKTFISITTDVKTKETFKFVHKIGAYLH